MRDWKFNKRKRKTIAVNRHGFLENKGFSLAELLIVVAIIGILAAFGFAALAQHQRSLKLTEDDNIAREIYAAVQNKLTQLSADGSWEKLVKDKGTDSSYWGESVSLDAAGDADESSAAHSFYRIVVNQGNVTADSNKLTLNNSVLGEKLLPMGAIDDTIRSSGSYIVEYDRATNQVRAVFYTDRTHGIFLSAQSGTLVSADANALRGKSRSERMHYSSDKLQDVCVGYYDGAVVNGEIPEDDSDDIPAASLTLTNGDNLVLSGALTWKQAASASQYQARIAVHGVTSGKEVYLSNGFTLTPASTALPNIVLDSDTERDRHFKQLCIDGQSTPLINGEDIFCTLEINGKVVATSNTENSLFATADSGEKGPTTVTVRNGRHLENLSEEISGIQTVTSARLAASISFSEYIGTGCIYDVSGKAQPTGEYIGIESSSLMMLDGGGYAISGLTIGQLSKEGGNELSSKNAGLISSILDTQTSFQISNLTLDSPSFAAISADNAGFIIGSANGKKITLSDVTVRNPAAKNLSSNSLGGLIGLAGAESVNIADCKVEGNNSLTLSNRGTVGGLIGSVSGGADGADVSIRASSLTAQSNSVISSANGSVGGLIGSYDGRVGASAALAISSSSVDVSGVSDLSGYTGAGGLIGEAKEGAVTLSGCSVSGLKKITSANGSAGGTVGALASTVSSFRQTGTAFKPSDSYLVTANNGSAGGLIGSSDAAAFVLRPGTAGSLSGIDSLTITGKNAGGVVGSLQFTEPSVLSYATLFAKKAVITGSVDAGGILGCGKESSSTLEFVGNYVKCADLSVNGKDAAGGMIAAIDGTSMHISSCRVSNEIQGANEDSIAITSKGTAGGMLGRARANGSELGTTASPALVISESSVETASLKVSAGSFAGGFIGQTENVISQITNSSVIGGKEGMAQSESSDAGGFIGRQTGSTASTFKDDFSSILVKSEGLSETAVGGFAGRLKSATVESCYAAGRTDKGAYQDSPYDQNVLASGNVRAFAGGFAGLTGSGTVITGSYSTCSVKNNSTAAGSTAGGFVGTNGGTISQSYCTGLVTSSQTSTAGIFAGNSSQKTGKGNYCLSDLDRNPALVSGDQADIAKAVLHADPAITGAGKVDSALPYDTVLGTSFPFKAVSELNQTSSIQKHVGDWPTQFKTRSFDQDCGILYYEAVQHGETKTKNPEYFYHGYMLNLPASSTSGEKNCVEVSTKDTLTPNSNTSLNEHGLDSAPGGGDYVIDDGYLILVAEDADLSKTGLYVPYYYHSIEELLNRNVLQEYNNIDRNLGISGYKAYYLCLDSVIHYDNQDCRWWVIDLPGLRFSKLVNYNWGNSIPDTIYANPYFADCISTKKDDVLTNYTIRSANQLNEVFKSGVCLSSNYHPSTVTIDMDITFSASTVDLIRFEGKKNNGYYISPTIEELNGTLKSAETPGRTITNVDGTEVKDHYRLIAVNNILAKLVQNGGEIDSVHFISANADCIATILGNSGNIKDCYIENSCFTGKGAIANSIPYTSGATISGCTVIKSTIKENGIAGDANALTVQNCYVLNNQISGNGLVGSPNTSSKIYDVTVSGNQISRNGIAGDANAITAKNCNVQSNQITGNGAFGSVNGGSSINNITVCDNQINGNGIAGDANAITVQDCKVLNNHQIGGNGAFVSVSGSSTSIRNVSVSGNHISGNGFLGSNSDGSSITSCTVADNSISGNGFLSQNKNGASISNCKVQNCTIGGNGFAESNGQSNWAPEIYSCFVINAAIGQNGFLYKNDGRGIIINCGVYSDNNTYVPSEQFQAPIQYLDNTVISGDNILGYNLVQIGDQGHETAAGFVNKNESTINNCFSTGKVIGKNAAGFFIENSGTITGSYANTLVYGGDIGAGYGLTLSGGTVEQSHSVGKIMGGNTQVGFVDTIQYGNINSCYSAVWSMKDDANNSRAVQLSN